MTPQEFVDTVYKDLMEWFQRAKAAAERDQDVLMCFSYGAADTAWYQLNEAIIAYGVLPTAWRGALNGTQTMQENR